MTEDKRNDGDAPLVESHHNQLVTFLVGGVLLGFVVALYLGAFSGKDYENLSNWFAVLIAAIAAGISAYAVFLVAQTLKATRETLDATREMAADQKRIGDAQTRPWLLVSSCNVIKDDNEDETAFVRIKNFGSTPARFITIKTRLWHDGGNIEEFHDDTFHYIAPGHEIVIQRDLASIQFGRYNAPKLGIHVLYFSVLDNANKLIYEVNCFIGEDQYNLTIDLI